MGNNKSTLLGLTKYLEELDKRAGSDLVHKKKYVPERKKRTIGSTLDSGPPKNAPKWTIDKEWMKGVLI